MEYRTSRKPQKNTGARRVIRKGWAWARWLMIPVVAFAIPQSLGSYIWINLLIIAVGVGLFFVFKRARRIEHDDENVYIIRDKKEKAIPFTDIISIKRSATKVNGERFWKLRYKDGAKERTIRYFRLFFNKEFQEAVKEKNPEVVIWTHPHFNH
ncbi:MGDG synthase family glycosyltransferase [Pseudotenacibaculum haliotis]|uniref:Diacylglycerol glucosyltransferase N-terminal domain-containing protein n=1 Tax=Pseudotenacibaculum haliotis TaxID=1862138 RepID=A0ABW5LW07_9FLAO